MDARMFLPISRKRCTCSPTYRFGLDDDDNETTWRLDQTRLVHRRTEDRLTTRTRIDDDDDGRRDHDDHYD